MTIKIASFFKNQGGPWGPWGGSDTSNGPSGTNRENDNKKPNEHPKYHQGKRLNPSPQDQIDQVIKEGKEFLKVIFGNDGSNGGGSGGNQNNRSSNSKNNTPKSIFGLLIAGILVLWLASGVYKVDSDENGLVLYFGKFHAISTPGLNYHLPVPFGKVIKKSVTNVNTEEFGFNSGSSRKSNSLFGTRSRPVNRGDENLMLTGDENIVDIDFQVQWQISDISDFVFNLEEPELAIRKASESAMREIIARTPIADALSDGKNRIEQEAKVLLQEVLDSYGAGVRVVLVQMLRVDPPSQVIDAFRDVQTAKADKEREINQAQAYQNDIIPRAKGQASKIIAAAKAYEKQVISDAQGQASRFNAIYYQYARAKEVTKKRMYLERMEKIYRDIDKVIIDKNISKTGAIPYLPINKINK